MRTDSAIANAIDDGKVQPPTLTEVSKVFKPTKKDLILVAKHVLAEQRAVTRRELDSQAENLKKDKKAVEEEISAYVLKGLDKVQGKYKGLEARLKKIVPGIEVKCNHYGGNNFNISINFHESVSADIPEKLQTKLDGINREIGKIDAARNTRAMGGCDPRYIRDDEVLNVLVTQRMQENGQMAALLEELHGLMQTDVRKSLGLASQQLQITVEN